VGWGKEKGRIWRGEDKERTLHEYIWRQQSEIHQAQYEKRSKYLFKVYCTHV
jgi:hypothetical protein